MKASSLLLISSIFGYSGLLFDLSGVELYISVGTFIVLSAIGFIMLASGDKADI